MDQDWVYIMIGHCRYANSDTPRPSENWARFSDAERLALVRQTIFTSLSDSRDVLIVAEAKSDGQVIVSLTQPVSAARRGTLLLDFEEFLKEKIDPGLVVWLEPLGDRSSLRNLRGIEVKS